MSLYIHKRHNVSVLLYHLVCVAKFRRVIFDQEIDKQLKQICLEIAKRYDIHFIEIGTDEDHVHFLIQSIPTYSPTKIVRTIKSITARELFRYKADLREKVWGAELWSDGYFINTVGRTGSESTITKYIQNQGKSRNYVVLHKDQLKMF